MCSPATSAVIYISHHFFFELSTHWSTDWTAESLIVWVSTWVLENARSCQRISPINQSVTQYMKTIKTRLQRAAKRNNDTDDFTDNQSLHGETQTLKSFRSKTWIPYITWQWNMLGLSTVAACQWRKIRKRKKWCTSKDTAYICGGPLSYIFGITYHFTYAEILESCSQYLVLNNR